MRLTSDGHLPSQDFSASASFRRVERGLAYDFFRFLKRPLEGLNSAESELTPADWSAIRKEALAKVEARKQAR